jgi:hypothetical protein
MAQLVEAWMDKQRPILVNPNVNASIYQWLGHTSGADFLTGLIHTLQTFRDLNPVIQKIVCKYVVEPKSSAQQCVDLVLELASGLTIGSQFEGSWALFIKAMFKAAYPHLATVAATASGRVGGLRAPQLRFSMSNLTSSIVSGPPTDGPANSWRLDGCSRTNSLAVLPMQVITIMIMMMIIINQ